MIRYIGGILLSALVASTGHAATPLLPLLPAGASPLSSFVFIFNPDGSFGDAAGAVGPVEGYVENSAIGDNTNFSLAATITAAGDPAALGGGYTLLYLVGTDPAFRISSSGKITFANAIFSRGGGSQTLTLTTGGSTAFTTGLASNNGSTSSYQEAASEPAIFGSITAAAVPEPSTWAMMIVGFGFVGWSLRKRRRANPTLAPGAIGA